MGLLAIGKALLRIVKSGGPDFYPPVSIFLSTSIARVTLGCMTAGTVLEMAGVFDVAHFVLVRSDADETATAGAVDGGFCSAVFVAFWLRDFCFFFPIRGGLTAAIRELGASFSVSLDTGCLVAAVWATVPALLFRASLWNTGHAALFAVCGPLHLAHVGGFTFGRGQSLAVSSSPQSAQAGGLWQL